MTAMWRMMEPEGDLPFWKPINPKRCPGLKMIHEGAKGGQVHNRTYR